MLLPKFDYHLDEAHPDVLVLRRHDGSFAGLPSAPWEPTEKASSRSPSRTLRGLLASEGLGLADLRC
jgi:hypothetical protein